ncbi:hypothetical protein D3C80_1298880 [compost metagenome]
MAPIVGGIQRFETQQGARGFAQVGRLGGRDACQPRVGQPAEAAHVQAQRRITRKFDGRVAQVHVAGNRQARTGFGQAHAVQSIAA